MNSTFVKILFSVASLWIMALVPVAANDVIVWCKGKADPAHPLSWQVLKQGLQPLLVNNNYAAAYQLVMVRFDDEQKKLVGEVDKEVADRFRDKIRLFLDGKVGRTTFNFISRNRGRENVLNLGGVSQASGTDHKVVIPCTDDAGNNISPERLASMQPQLANLAYTAHALSVISGRDVQALFGETARVIDDRREGYRGMLFDGLPMWPWELWANGLGIDQDDLTQSAPRTQWTLLRPSAGLEVYWPSRRSANIEASVAIEPIGFVRYRGSAYKHWWGISTLVTLGTGDNGAGIGGLLRYDNYALGITKRKDIDDVYVFLTFDLYDALRDKQARSSEAEEFIKRLREKAE